MKFYHDTASGRLIASGFVCDKCQHESSLYFTVIESALTTGDMKLILSCWKDMNSKLHERINELEAQIRQLRETK